MIEHEKKFKIGNATSSDSIKQKLLQHGFKYIGQAAQKDTYYSRADVDFMETKECLRIREEDGTAELTYKPPTTQAMLDSMSIWKKETNIDLRPEQVADTYDFLASLGCKKLCTVDKHRETYKKDDITVALDTINGLGDFIEIEILSEDTNIASIDQIDNLAAQLAIDTTSTVELPYRDLLMLSQATV